MKKLLFLVALLALSCSKEDESHEPPNSGSNALQLVSKKTEVYLNDILNTTSHEFYDNGKPFRSEFVKELNTSAASYTLYEYKNGLLDNYKSFFQKDNSLIWERVYTYDSEGRITQVSDYDHVNTALDCCPTGIRKLTYQDNKILSIKEWYTSSGNLAKIDSSQFTVNTDNRITHYERTNHPGGEWAVQIDYNENKTPFKFEYFGEYPSSVGLKGITEYSYSQKKDMDVIPRARLIFGEKWKNNTLLTSPSAPYHTTIGVLSDYYYLGFERWNEEKTGLYDKKEITYEFDTEGRLSKIYDTYEDFQNGTTTRTEVSYEYE